MAVAKELMSVEEYLQTSFEDSDCDYVDGEVVERNMGEWLHARLQYLLTRLLDDWTNPGLKAVTEVRIQISPRRYRVADVAVWLSEAPVGLKIPLVPPFLVVEILSPKDRITRFQPRISDYLQADVGWVWVIDPYVRQALVYSQTEPGGSLAEVLTTADPEIRIELADVLSKLPEA